MGFQLLPCLPIFALDLHQSIKDRLGEGESLTHDVALRILKQIKWESDVKAFFSKPIVVLPIGILILAISLLIPHLTVALTVLRMILGGIGGGIIGYTIENTLCGQNI